MVPNQRSEMIRVDTGIDYYQRVTGRRYSGESPEVMGRLMQEITSQLEEEADMFVLVGFVREIHTTLDLGKLETFTDLQLSEYNDLWWSADEVSKHRYKDPQQLLNDKLKRVEQRRYYRYIKDVLLCGEDGEFGGVSTYYKFPSVSQIMDRGMSAWFMRIGELTVESLVDRYSTYELLTFAKMLSFVAQRPFILGVSASSSGGTKTTKDELAAIVIDLTEQANLDPRIYLTDTAPIVLHKDWEYNLFMVDHAGIMAKMIDYGLNSDDRPGALLNVADSYHKLVFAQLDNNFWDKPYEFLSIEEQIVNTTLYTDPSTLILDVDWPLYFGKGDGVERFKVFSQGELDTLWRKDLRFTNPSVEGSTFSLRQVKSLLQLDGTRDFLRGTILDLIPKAIWRDPIVEPTPRISKSSLKIGRAHV